MAKGIKGEIDNYCQSNSEKERNRIAEYWTPERRRKAIPISPPLISKEQMQKLKKSKPPKNINPECIESYLPDEVENVRGTPTEANVEERPFWNGGKLFFTGSDGKNYCGSAEFCGRNNILLTAAHCVRDHVTGEWYKNMIFYRAYKKNSGQRVDIISLNTQPEWVTGGSYNFHYDFAFLVTSTISGAGWLGLKPYIPYSSWTAIGYPSNYQDGNYMQRVDGTMGIQNSDVVQMVGNPMGGGCSGGAWIAELTTPYVGGNYAVGLNSYTFNDGNLWSPYFDNSVMDLYYKVAKISGK